MKDSQQESHTLKENTEEKVKTLDYFYNEKGDYTITLKDNPIALTLDKASAQKLCAMYNGMEAMIKEQVKRNTELYANLQKIKALTTEIR